MKTRIDLLKESMGGSSLKAIQSKKLELNLYEVSELHKRMVRAYRRAQDAWQQSYVAHSMISDAKGDLYVALNDLEAHMRGLEEAHGLRGISQYVTFDPEPVEEQDPHAEEGGIGA